jgi:hypothetical protein
MPADDRLSLADVMGPPVTVGADLAAASLPAERTPLTQAQEVAFQHWAQASGIRDVDHPDSRYDYRGLFLARGGQPVPKTPDRHFPDTFKQHGHPTFSIESQYSRGRWDGGQWLPGDVLVPPPVASHGGRR